MGNTDTPSAEEITAEQDEFVPITSQTDLDRIISARLIRERKKYEDYEELKGLAARVPDLQAELDAANAQITQFKEAEQRASWLSEVSGEFDVPSELLRGSSLDELKEHASALRDHLSEVARPEVKVNSDLGKQPEVKATSLQRTAGELFGD